MFPRIKKQKADMNKGFYREEADRLVRADTENIKREEKKSEIQ